VKESHKFELVCLKN